MNINAAMNSNRLMKSVTGLSVKEFKQLAEGLERELEKEKQTQYKKGLTTHRRKRKPGGGRKGALKTTYEKLFFILFYFKCYPTFDLSGLLFDFNRSNACRNVQKLTPLLEKTLGEKMVLPKREIHTLKELLDTFPEVHDLIIDGTERPIQRPKDNEKQKKNYSGKKKRHTKKNTIISSKDKKIRYLGPTVEGKKHDYGSFKDEFPNEPPSKPPPDTPQDNPRFWMDLAYLGIEKDYPGLNVRMPKKKPKGRELTEEEKTRNKQTSSIRVKVEHAIGGVKRFGIVSNIFRNKSDDFNDKVMELACGLWNYHLMQ